ncbi:hypothetical protein JTE90_010048 [Oedothorax gibbosus]|uniref:cyclin-dependent kinase n=1 Tax=Oedothorax gibbosus TaxID=931172 RepID=A0AAV6V5B3_9ARAC|nr:hypothetical protein JTE90_010048 [Oedothorax gibbosus]
MLYKHYSLLMAYHDNLRAIPLTGNDTESEEDGEIEKEAMNVDNSNEDDRDVTSSSESSSKDENDEDGDSLDIKPPQAIVKTKETHHDEKRKSHHSRKHESHRSYPSSYHNRERSQRRERPSSYVSNFSRRDQKEGESRTVRYRDDTSRVKERDHRKPGDSSQKVTEIREIRLKKDVRDSRDRGSDSKSKEERHSDNIVVRNRLEEKKMEWRKKRLMFINKQKEPENEGGSKSRPSKDDNISTSRDLREKLREKERMLRERERGGKERRPHRYRSPKKEEKGTEAVEPVVENKKEVHVPQEEEEVMDYEVDKEELEDEESDQQSDRSEEKEEEKDDTETDSDSSGSDTEGSGHSKMDEEEEVAEEESSEEEAAEPAKVEEAKAPEEPKPVTSPVKQEELPQAPELPNYLPSIMGCRSVEEFHCLNRIEEGTYGVVYRARDKRTNEIVALKRLKMEKEKEGFPITSLREINTLLKAQHINIVTVREIVVGSNMDKIYIVMDYVEHDLKSLMETMKQPFLVGEVKTLMHQLLCAVAHLHDNWILHRDLKTSNLLLSHKGILKVGDFGLAREYGSPLKPYTPVVVTLWYRAPELLLGAKQYSTPIDMWSVGCIFGELLTMKPLFPGKSEIDQLNRVFKDLGTPSEKIWHGYSELPLVKKVTFTEYPYNNLRSRFGHNFTDLGFDLLNRFLTYNPTRRITAEDAKKHDFFSEKPKPVAPSMFPTWPAKSEQGHRKAQSPKPPSGGKQYARQMVGT